jgi:hypothetical protein
VRSLALVTNLLDDVERLAKVLELVLSLLPRHLEHDDVRGSLQASLLPVLAIWLRQHSRDQYYDFLQRMLDCLQETSTTSQPHKVSRANVRFFSTTVFWLRTILYNFFRHCFPPGFTCRLLNTLKKLSLRARAM